MTDRSYVGLTKGQLAKGFLALIGDHASRGMAFALEEDLVDLDGPWPSLHVLHEMGAFLTLGQWIEDGTLRAVAPDVRRSSGFCRLGLQFMKPYLYRPAPHMRQAPLGSVGWLVVGLRFRAENWWEDGPQYLDDRLSRLVGAVDVRDETLDAFARLLWARRGVSLN